MVTNSQDEDQIWTRRKSEPGKAYALFCIYRDMGASRTLEKTVKEISEREELRQLEITSIGGLSHYSAKWNWVERAEDYDDYLDENFRTKHEKRIMEMRIRQADKAKEWQDEIIKLKEMYSKAENVKSDDFKTPGGLAWFHESLMKVYGQACMIEQDALLCDDDSSDDIDEQKRREEFVKLFKEVDDDDNENIESV